jgi:light-regulated signal transduction histidine kinase (bacteriophytochrome)
MVDSVEFDASIEILVATCEQEQLHLSDHIQSFGALLRLDRETGIVTHVSANLDQFLPLAVADTLGKSVPPLLASLVEALPPGQRTLIVREWCANGLSRPLDVRLTGDPRFVLMEWEPTTGHGEHLRNFRKYQHSLLTAPVNHEEWVAYHQTLIDQIREITQFDRVMIYQFLEDWSGEVIAEFTYPERGSYLGLRFPASDIPAIARNLYKLNPYRMIPEANTAPVPLLSYDGATLDLSYADLRSVSPVHVLYLNNMSVVASFSVSILTAGKLWGLVACHHAKPAFLSLQDREACAHLVHNYGLGMTSFGIYQRTHLFENFTTKIEEAVKEIALSCHVKNKYRKLLEILAADGIVLGLGDELLTFGETPQPEAMTLIDRWFVNHHRENIFTTDRLRGLSKEIGEIAVNSCGLLAIKVKSPRSGWIRFFWFRNELVYKVSWAGNPNKPLLNNTTTQILSPRRSFEKWVEEKTGYSQPWTNKETIISGMLRSSLLQWL